VVLDGLARPGILDDPPEDLLEQAYADVSEPKGRAAVWTDERGREERALERGGKTAD